MIFNQHFNLAGQHAFLSASKHHWINYDEDKLARYFETQMLAQRGTELHDLAHRLIRLKVKLPNSRKTLNRYVNDALGYRMTPEQALFYSINCFGTPDAISFSDRNLILRISDLKTGVTKASFNQLLVYAALFCLEYGYKPFELERMELRIYQSDDVKLEYADPAMVTKIMDTIVTWDVKITQWREETGR